MIVLLKDREGVHIGADGDHLAAFTDLRDDTRLADAAFYPVSHFLQFICDDLRCPMKFKTDLGMHVEIAPPFDEFL